MFATNFADMLSKKISLILADDDPDDCDFFKDALGDLTVDATLTTVHNGVDLMQLLAEKETTELPDGLFLDLNMPRKNGVDCLKEIRRNDTLKQLPVVIFSTSFDKDVVKMLQQLGANYYICKPGAYAELKKTIQKAISHLTTNNSPGFREENFVIQA